MIKFYTRQSDERIQRMLHRLANFAPVLKKIGTEQVNNAKKRIKSTKSDPDGKSWAPWAYSTLKNKTKGSMLYTTGFLFNQFKTKTTKTRLEVDNTASYAHYLQFGTNKMPARPFVGWSNQDKKKMAADIGKHIKGRL